MKISNWVLYEPITNFCGHLPRYHELMASVGSQIVVALLDKGWFSWLSKDVTIKISSNISGSDVTYASLFAPI